MILNFFAKLHEMQDRVRSKNMFMYTHISGYNSVIQTHKSFHIF